MTNQDTRERAREVLMLEAMEWSEPDYGDYAKQFAKNRVTAILAALESSGLGICDRTTQSVRSSVAPFSVECDDCGQVVTLERGVETFCGCTGVTWTLARKG